mmetsp:Transcript_11578/g.19850  ORF Transcript_11578/g.19850 Transcript_11578/m.19850 type:complete len:209 (-) Transcript_11578:538-1164(-)
MQYLQSSIIRRHDHLQKIRVLRFLLNHRLEVIIGHSRIRVVNGLRSDCARTCARCCRTLTGYCRCRYCTCRRRGCRCIFASIYLGHFESIIINLRRQVLCFLGLTSSTHQQHTNQRDKLCTINRAGFIKIQERKRLAKQVVLDYRRGEYQHANDVFPELDLAPAFDIVHAEDSLDAICNRQAQEIGKLFESDHAVAILVNLGELLKQA